MHEATLTGWSRSRSSSTTSPGRGPRVLRTLGRRPPRRAGLLRGLLVEHPQDCRACPLTRRRTGGSRPSSTRSTRAASPTATATAGRPRRHHRPPRPPRAAGSRRRLAEPGLPVADGRQRLRHQRLRGRRPALRRPGAARRADRRSARPRHEAGHGPRRQPHQLGPRLVPGLAVAKDDPKRDWYWWRPPREGFEAGTPGAEPTNWARRSPARRGPTTPGRVSTTSTCSRRSSPTSTGRTPSSARRSTR